MTKKIDYNKWHSGPPPSVGWWPASAFRCEKSIRWWDGSRWSIEATPRTPIQIVGQRAATLPEVIEQHEIEWQHRPASWPARSRT